MYFTVAEICPVHIHGNDRESVICKHIRDNFSYSAGGTGYYGYFSIFEECLLQRDGRFLYFTYDIILTCDVVRFICRNRNKPYHIPMQIITYCMKLPVN